MVEDIYRLLSPRRFNLENEKEVQRQIELVFIEKNIAHEREYVLGDGSIVDFFCNGIGIEIKIKGNKKEIYKQCERYCLYPQITHLILVTSKSMGMLQSINDKPVYLLKVTIPSYTQI